METLRSKARLVAATCACTGIRKASRAVTQLYESALVKSGLGAGQFTALVAACVAGEDGLPITHLAKVLVLDRTSLSRTLQPLERAGLINLAKGREDARVRRVRLTARGARKLEEALHLWEKTQRRFLALVGAPLWGQLGPDLERVTSALADD